MNTPPRTLTVDELDALPPGSFVTDIDGDVWVKHPSGQWLTENGDIVSDTELSYYNPRPYTHNPTND